ncbi:glutathione hydrolase 1 proenzyme-like isoform X2 [Coccinella septempunctata]|uniref:glutathione hydrolase 1 proenzyme-like isoform X2 n=1 Tax=Coccinella septempunctata TaxID=41139 RepID=UPI001D065ACA|nr:glutathione hydrolase 1 proenzyme-like isoform X2 [Coccinella septempunctata]
MDLNHFENQLGFIHIIIIFLVVCLVLVLYYTYDLEVKSKHNPVFEGGRLYKEAALASTSQFCEEYVIEAYRKGGSAADAAIIALSVQGLTSPQSLGIGGGFLLLYYDRKEAEMHVLNAREYSPSKTTKDMFKNCRSPAWGGLSSAVPGEICGYWELHKRFGRLPWASLFEPAISLCRQGIPVTKITGEMLIKMRTLIMNSPTLKEIFCDEKTGDVYKYGDLMKRPALARTFDVIAREGAEGFYDGRLTEQFVKDVVDHGGIMTVEDMNNYKAKWTSPMSMELPTNKRIYTTPCPGSGQVFLAILDVIFSLGKSESPGVNWFRIVEAWKHAFGHRSVMDGPQLCDEPKEENYDPSMAKIIVELIKKRSTTSPDVRHYSTDFEKLYKEGGTCHISLLAPDGDAVSVTSSVNYAIGAMYASTSTGIIMNNHMMDFAIPDFMDKFYIGNQLAPNKQPVSCMVPSIVVNSRTKDVKMVVGAAGGFKILTAASQLILETLLFDIPQDYAIVHRRLHHQLIPMVLFYEDEFPEHILEEMRRYGHHVERILPGTSGAIITISKDGIRASGDPRRMGSSAGY